MKPIDGFLISLHRLGAGDQRDSRLWVRTNKIKGSRYIVNHDGQLEMLCRAIYSEWSS
ncbi:MAG TPA: hypothetical protein VJ719_13875 [Chthoniobacterales bacterium]|nr:hypothetical protein [Chthoniobacterales bacterium]